MDNKEFKQELINEILLNIKPSYYKNYKLNVRCPFCGDLPTILFRSMFITKK